VEIDEQIHTSNTTKPGSNMIIRATTSTALRLTRNFHSSTPVRGLLKKIPPILTADLLQILRSAGHGDQIALVDCNFPARQVATKTTTGKHIELAGVDLPEACDAICQLLPLDYFIDCPAEYMVPSDGNETPILATEVHDGLKQAIEKHAEGVHIQGLERFAFYDAASEAFAIVQCSGERRPYGNVILTKGVVGPDGNDLKP
jgi:L-fucose mutarotase